MKCMFCLDGLENGRTLYRMNPTGQKGVWCCEEHRSQSDTRIDPEVLAIVQALTPSRNRNHKKV